MFSAIHIKHEKSFLSSVRLAALAISASTEVLDRSQYSIWLSTDAASSGMGTHISRRYRDLKPTLLICEAPFGPLPPGPSPRPGKVLWWALPE